MHSTLFLCTGNSARSQLAEALFRQVAGAGFHVFSAGTEPQPVDERVYQALAELNIDVPVLHSKTIAELPVQTFDFVITLCDRANRECAAYPPFQALLHWDLMNPRSQPGMAPFMETALQLQEKIALFLRLNNFDEIFVSESPVDFFKVLADATRLRILMMIEDDQELCVSELTKALQESQPKISRHLAQMRETGIVDIRRQGQLIYYRLADALPIWCHHVLVTARNGNPAFINNEKIRLKAMADRPVRCIEVM